MATTRLAICLFDASFSNFDPKFLVVGDKLRSISITDPLKVEAELFIRDADPSLPEWTSIVSNFANLGMSNLRTSSSGAILFVKIKKRILACCFGSSVSSINRNNIETDFGLGVAFKNIGPDLTKQIESLTLSDVPVTNRRNAT